MRLVMILLLLHLASLRLMAVEPAEGGEVDLARKAYVIDGSTVEMHDQIGHAVAELDAERQRLVVELRGHLDLEEQAVFRLEQSAWENHVEAQVTLEAFAYRGGTLSGVVAGRRRIELLQGRLLALRNLIDLYAPH